MALKKFLMIGVVAALVVACDDDSGSNSVTDSDEVSSSSVKKNSSSSAKAKSSSSKARSSSSSAKSSSSSKQQSSSSSIVPSSSKDIELGEKSSSGSLVNFSSSETSVSSSSSVKLSSSSVASSSSILVEYVDPSTVVKGTMTDERDGQTYNTVKIGSQTWMAENLNYAYTGASYDYHDYISDSISWCYHDSVEYCNKYGRLYTWAAAMDSAGSWTTNGKGCGYNETCSPTYLVRGICPEGWHLPTESEWYMLFTAVDGESIAAWKLKSTSGWYDSGNGSGAYFFAALPAGGSSDGNYDGESYNAFFWSSTENDTFKASLMSLGYYNHRAYMSKSYKYSGCSVRCVKD